MAIPIFSSAAILNSPIVDGWLLAARKLPSPNMNERPCGSTLSLLVIHNISLPPEQFGGGYIEQFFCNQLNCSAHEYFQEIADLQVSSHLLITREGELVQFVPFDKRAWHAGRSSFQGQDECNDYSIGVELEGADTIAYTEQQYFVLAAITQRLQQEYPLITRDRITGHSDIAPGRKTDPGPAFNWQQYMSLLND